MSDFGDKASEISAKDLQRALRGIDTNLEVSVTGKCYSCGEKVHPPLRWCDADCRDDWEKNKRLNKGVL